MNIEDQLKRDGAISLEELIDKEIGKKGTRKRFIFDMQCKYDLLVCRLRNFKAKKKRCIRTKYLDKISFVV